MTQEEIEKLVAAEVDRRLGAIVGQIGKDLEDRYATKDLVDERVEARAKAEMAGFNRAMLQATDAISKGETLPPGHPLAALVQVLDELTDLEMRVMELGLYIVANHRGKHQQPREDPRAYIERGMKLDILCNFMADREHCRILDATGKAKRMDSEAAQMVEQFSEILGPRPETKG